MVSSFSRYFLHFHLQLSKCMFYTLTSTWCCYVVSFLKLLPIWDRALSSSLVDHLPSKPRPCQHWIKLYKNKFIASLTSTVYHCGFNLHYFPHYWISWWWYFLLDVSTSVSRVTVLCLFSYGVSVVFNSALYVSFDYWYLQKTSPILGLTFWERFFI
jgi:hypothetical protein